VPHQKLAGKRSLSSELPRSDHELIALWILEDREGAPLFFLGRRNEFNALGFQLIVCTENVVGPEAEVLK
jgi:hypothetical protein